MKLGLRAWLFGLSSGVVLVSCLALFAYADPVLERRLMAQARQELRVRARLVALLAEARQPLSADPQPESLMRLSQALAREVGGPVKLFRADGSLLASSDGRIDSLSYARAPDFLGAGTGGGAFLSEGRHLHTATRFRLADGAAAVVRVGQALAPIDEERQWFRQAAAGGALSLLALALLVSEILVRRMARGLGALTDVARRMAAGELAARSGVEGEDEIVELGRTLDKLGRGLSSTLAELREERDRLAGILEGMQEGVLLLGGRRQIVLVNPALREMLLLPADTMGKPLLDVMRNAELRDLFEAAATTDEPTIHEVEIGSIKPRRLLVRVARMPGGRAELVAVFVDVTEVRRLESVRRDFVANVSHELRTPVTSIRSAAETLIDGAAADPAAAHTFIGIIDRNAQRLHALVEDLLDLSRIEARGFRLTFEPIELGSVFSQVLGLFRERAAAARVALAERPRPELPRVRADRRGLEHVLTNLVDNAVKYGGAGTQVWLGVSVSEQLVTVSVSDDGPGIDERHLQRVFERFYRVDAGRSRDVGGTGLGLSIVKHLVEAMGGSVSVESRPGQGTTFSFTLKRADRVEGSAAGAGLNPA